MGDRLEKTLDGPGSYSKQIVLDALVGETHPDFCINKWDITMYVGRSIEEVLLGTCSI